MSYDYTTALQSLSRVGSLAFTPANALSTYLVASAVDSVRQGATAASNAAGVNASPQSFVSYLAGGELASTQTEQAKALGTAPDDTGQGVTDGQLDRIGRSAGKVLLVAGAGAALVGGAGYLGWRAWKRAKRF